MTARLAMPERERAFGRVSGVDSRERCVLVILASLALLVGAASALFGVSSDLLLVVPLFVLLVPLLVGRYPGEQAIARLASQGKARGRQLPGRAPVPQRRSPVFARGGLLLATGLAGRPPPVCAQLLS